MMNHGRVFLVLLLMVAVGVVAGCDGGPGRRAPTTGDGAATEGGHGLLLTRRQSLVLRDMESGSERVLKPAKEGATYSYPRWSPDGRRIAFVVTTAPGRGATDNWGSAVAVSAPDGAGERIVLKGARPGLRVEGLAWSADGGALYVSTVDQDGAGLKLERLDLGTSNRATVAEEAAYPTVSPDGSRIAFLRYSSGAHAAGLWTAKPDGSDQRLIVAVPERFAGLRWPRFSPDGTRIGFGAVDSGAASLIAPECRETRRWPWQPRPAAAHGPPIDIWAIPTTGGTAEKLADLGEDDPVVAWSADGRRLAIMGGCGLYELALGGDAPRRLDRGAWQSQIDWR
jgi:Tol biopolymer transport system component